VEGILSNSSESLRIQFNPLTPVPPVTARDEPWHLVARMASCRVTNAFSTRLKLIWPQSSFKTTKMSKKKQFWQKVPGVNGLIKTYAELRAMQMMHVVNLVCEQ